MSAFTNVLACHTFIMPTFEALALVGILLPSASRLLTLIGTLEVVYLNLVLIYTLASSLQPVTFSFRSTSHASSVIEVVAVAV